MPQTVTLLGATGSIGRSTTDVLLAHPEAFAVEAVVGGRDAPGLAAVARRLGARFAALADEAQGSTLREALDGSGIASGAGESAVLEAAEREVDVTVAGIAGTAGLKPTYAALKQGNRLALANKESLICAGEAFMREAKRRATTILPMDSEHNALHQALGAGRVDDVVTLTITASGGPFRTWTAERIAVATPAATAAHPTYSMGAKINVDSASLMNKGLELIEAHHLFGVGPDRLDAVVHPQSIVHGFVQWRDGSVTAGMGTPDMRIPIAHCLMGEGRLNLPGRGLDLAAIGTLTFEAPDLDRFPCFGLARAALARGGAMPTVLNAANEVAVAAFLAGRIGFPDIARVVERTCEAAAGQRQEAPFTVEDALTIDAESRRIATESLPSVR